MKCKVPDCKNKAEGYYIDDLEVCQNCYSNSIDMEYELKRDDIGRGDEKKCVN